MLNSTIIKLIVFWTNFDKKKKLIIIIIIRISIKKTIL